MSGKQSKEKASAKLVKSQESSTAAEAGSPARPQRQPSSKSELSAADNGSIKPRSSKTQLKLMKSSVSSATVAESPSKVQKESNIDEKAEVRDTELTPAGVTTTPSSTSRITRPSRKLGSAVALDLSFDETRSSPNRRFPESKIIVQPNVKKVYKMINNRTGSIGGNGTTGAIYGELTIGSMQKVINILKEKCELNHSSRFIDVGAGLGKPNLHAAQDPAVRISIGIELETIRWQLSMFNLEFILKKIIEHKCDVHGNVNFISHDIDGATTMDPFTHIYMYDLGFPPQLQQSIAKKFNGSVHSKFLVSYRPPHRVIDEYLYEVELVDRVPTSMHGSGEVHTAYIYKRTTKPPSITSNDNVIRIPGREEFEEEEEDVACDPLFYPAIKTLLEGVHGLHSYVQSVSKDHMAAGRPARERKPVKR